MYAPARALMILLVFAASARPAVNLSLHPVEDPVPDGQTALIVLLAENDSAESQPVAALDVILHWDPTELRLSAEVIDPDPNPWAASTFPVGPAFGGINESLDDGDAVYSALGPLGQNCAGFTVPPFGQVVFTTFQFDALAVAPSSSVEIVAQQGPFIQTQVLAPCPANLNVLGTITGTSLTVVACGSEDYNSDGAVDIKDFAAFQTCLTPPGGTASTACACVFDADGDQVVDAADYAAFAQALTGPVVR